MPISMNHQKPERLPGAQQLEETDQYGEYCKSRYWVQREIALCLPVTPFIYKLFFAGSSDCLRRFGSVFTAWWTMWSAARRAGGGDLRTWWGAEGRKQGVSPVLINTTCWRQKEAVLTRRIHPGGERRAALPAAREVRAVPWALTSPALPRNSLPTVSLPQENGLSLGRMIPRSLSLGNS